MAAEKKPENEKGTVDKNTRRELNKEDSPEDEETRLLKLKKRILILAIIGACLFLIVGTALIMWLLLSGPRTEKVAPLTSGAIVSAEKSGETSTDNTKSGETDTADSAATANADQKTANSDTSGGEGDIPKQSLAKTQPYYITLEPRFIVELKKEGKSSIFMQVEVTILTHNLDTKTMLELHSPRIKNNLINLFSTYTFTDLSTKAGKEKLRGESLDIVNTILSDFSKVEPAEAVYFSTLVLQ